MAVKKDSVKTVEDKVVSENIGETVEKVVEKKVKKPITKDTEVVIMNNTQGIFTYNCPRTHDTFGMETYGDTDVMTVEHLNTMRNQHRTILDKYWILPIAVNDSEIEISDVLKHLRIEHLYKDIELDLTFFDDLILRSTVKNFEKAIDGMNASFVERIAERAVMLYKDKRFADSFKMEAIEKAIKNDDLFEDVKNTMK
jgi:hypothetical protein